MDYITIDFETANQNLTSACSIGIVGVVNNKIVIEEHYLINPREEFNEYNISIHNIKPSDVEFAEPFDIIWEKIKQYFNNTIVFAHNASFDISVLKAVIDKYHLDPPNIKFGCTYNIASKLWKDELKNHKLNTLASYLEVNHLHHNALSDAKVCVEIITRGQKVMNVNDVSELYDSLGIRYGVYNQNRLFSSLNKYVRNPKVKIIENMDLNEKVIFISGKPKSLPKNQLIQKLEQNGAYIEKNINRSLDYFVELGNCPRRNLELVNILINKDTPITIMDEESIIKLIK